MTELKPTEEFTPIVTRPMTVAEDATKALVITGPCLPSFRERIEGCTVNVCFINE
jgi:hypothetical protein